MPTVLLVTGTCGVGKTTTSREWSTRRGGAHVRGDDIRVWIRSKELRRARDYQHEAVARIAATAAEEFIAQGMDVALDFVWLPSTLRYLSNRLSKVAKVRMVWLRCERAENRVRDAQRPPGDVMGERVHELQAELDAISDWPGELLRIDSSGKSVHHVVDVLNRPT